MNLLSLTSGIRSTVALPGLEEHDEGSKQHLVMKHLDKPSHQCPQDSLYSLVGEVTGKE